MSELNLNEAYRSYQDELVAAGLLIPSGVPGVYGRSGTFETVVERFRDRVTAAAAPLKAELQFFPPILNRAHYAKTEHIHNFPNLMGSVHSFVKGEREQLEMIRKLDSGEDWTRDLDATGVMLCPAVCYPLYPTLAGTLPAGGRTVDLTGYVFRHEPSDDPARMQIFRQHEYVCAGTPAQAAGHRDFWIEAGKKILQSVGLDVRVEVAHDPFFGRGGRLRKATQREQDLKHEFLVPICSKEEPTAVASCNYHLESFGAKFKIQTPDGKIAHSSCIGFGLERVALALFKTHGFDVKAWPREVRAFMKLDE